MRTLNYCRNIVSRLPLLTTVCLLLGCYGGYILAQEPTMMTREEAAVIAQKVIQAGQWPGTMFWTTVEELPAQQEVWWDDTDLQALLAEQDKSYITIDILEANWWQINSPFEGAYIFPLTYDPLPEGGTAIGVNPWTGYVELRPARGDKTNTELGLGSYPILSLEEQTARALQIAEAVLGARTFVVRSIRPPEGDTGEYTTEFLIYKVDPDTGARLPKIAFLEINSRTGWLESARIMNRPTTVSTTPTLTKEQARKIAAQYLQNYGYTPIEWPEDYVSGGEYHGGLLLEHLDTGLFVVEDGLLEQHLVWMFVYAATWTDAGGQAHERPGAIAVNAHTGQIMTDFTTLIHALPRRQRLNWHQSCTYEIFALEYDGKDAYLWMPMRLHNGRVYIWVNYADNFGAAWDGSELRGRYGAVRLEPSERWTYKGQLYLPLRRICEVMGVRIWWNNKVKKPILRGTGKIPKHRFNLYGSPGSDIFMQYPNGR